MGGLALAVWGAPRATEDIDSWLTQADGGGGLGEAESGLRRVDLEGCRLYARPGPAYGASRRAAGRGASTAGSPGRATLAERSSRFALMVFTSS